MNGISKHHLWYPRRDYQTRLEKTFRALQCQIVLLDDHTHRSVHRHSEPPHKPSHEEMVAALERHAQGVCKCTYRKGD